MSRAVRPVRLLLALLAALSTDLLTAQETVGVPTHAGSRLWIVSTRTGQPEPENLVLARYRVWRGSKQGLGRETTLEDLIAELTPGAPVLIMVHGSFVEWASVMRDAYPTFCWIQQTSPLSPLNVICFSWPSDNTPQVMLASDVNLLGQRAGRQGMYVADLIGRIPDSHPVCLLGHSHGARVVVSCLHVLGGGRLDAWRYGGGTYNQHRIRAVLAAAAVDHNWLNPDGPYADAPRRAERLVNLINQEDFALGLYPLRSVTSSYAVARTGFTREDRLAIGPAAAKLQDLDITDLIQARHTWTHYYRQPEIAAVIRPHVFFDGTDGTVLPQRRGAPLLESSAETGLGVETK